MATEAQIRKHQRLLDGLISDFESDLRMELDRAYDSVAALGVDAQRTEVLAVFENVRTWADSEVAKLDSVISSNIEMNAAVLGTDVAARTLQGLSEVRAQMASTLRNLVDQEQNRVIETVVLAGIAGAAARDLVGQTRSIQEGSQRRLSTAFGNAVYQFDAIVTRSRSERDQEQRFQYVGGIIESTRSFCRSLDNQIFTESEIIDIWRDSWPGQAPGDPFVVRGGYNCRHTWVAVEAEE
jgi:hypothetical protein